MQQVVTSGESESPPTGPLEDTATSDFVTLASVTREFETADGVVRALDPISVSIQRGEFVALLGPSGCGKSTLLSIAGGLDRPTSGVVSVGGERIVSVPSNIGMMFQTPVLLAWRSVLRNVLLPCEVAGGSKAAREARSHALELLKMAGLEGFEKKLPAQLSGGMQQRVAICRMLISDPALLLLDEPFSALDEITRERMNLELSRICRTMNRTAMFVTHSIQEAIFLADRVLVMTERPGKIGGEIAVELEYPRSSGVITSDQFQEYVRRARELLHLGDSSAPEEL